MLMALVYMGWHVSGAQYNPAVTLALVVRGDCPGSRAAGFIGAQCLGAAAAALAVAHITGSGFVLMPGADTGAGTALAVEVLFTFLLMIVIFNVAVTPRTAGNSLYGLAIGFTITGAAFAGGPLSGGAFNPAVGIMPGLVEWVIAGRTEVPFWLYLVGPLIGAFLAVPLFMMQEAAAMRGAAGNGGSSDAGD
ncbi:MAG: porin [Gemmatimonadetes bacterium]|nr:porin [Gemmatimonadota bacterium]